MATEQLTLDGLMDLLCDYRQTVGGKCPIAIQYGDSGSYALSTGLVHAVYLERAECDAPVVAPLRRILGLGADVSGYLPAEAPQIALCLRPWCPPHDADAMTTAWPDALEAAR